MLVEDGDDVYALNLLTRQSELLYTNVEKIESISFDENIKDDLWYEEHIKYLYSDLKGIHVENSYLRYMWKTNNKDILGFIWILNQNGFWWILVFENWVQRFTSIWNELTFPSWDVDVYRPAYILEDGDLIVYSNACAVSKFVHKLENNISNLEKIWVQ